jgi:hypothetical protein
MPKFIMIYRGEATDMSEMTPEEGAAVLAKWEDWMGRVGDALVDVGTPFGPGVSVVDDGSSGSAASLTGFSIVSADDIEGAKALTDGHPYLSDGGGAFAIDVYEMMPVPFEA